MSDHSETLVSIFRDTVAAHPNRVALVLPNGESPPRTLTWSEIARDAGRLAVALHRLGVRAGDRIVQVGENRYEWLLLDIAVHIVRGVHVAVHSALSGPQIAWQIRDCDARAVFLSNAEQVAKLAADNLELPNGFCTVTFDPVQSQKIGQWPTMPMINVLPKMPVDDVADAMQAAALAETRPDDLATILYTSGTTGQPKGVMLSHANLVSNARGMLAAFPNQDDELRLCWLPLSHIYSRTCDLYTWIIGGTQLALAESRERILANCQSLHPTLLNGVPYFFDKVRRHVESLPDGKSPGRLSELLGGKLRLCNSGGAALPVATAEY